MSLISLFIMSLLTQNIVLTKFLGICPFVGTSSREKNALGMGISVTLVMVFSSGLTFLLYHYLLVPTHTEYLRTVVFILVIACFVQFIEMLLKRYMPSLYKALGIYLPLITTNCAILGVTLLNINNDYQFLEMLIFSIGSGLGFTLVIYVFASIRERLATAKVPESFKGYPIAFVVAAIMALLFARYVGL